MEQKRRKTQETKREGVEKGGWKKVYRNKVHFHENVLKELKYRTAILASHLDGMVGMSESLYVLYYYKWHELKVGFNEQGDWMCYPFPYDILEPFSQKYYHEANYYIPNAARLYSNKVYDRFHTKSSFPFVQ